jgi:hypothetical protein
MVDILGADAALFWMPSIHALSSNSFVNTSSRGLSPCHMGMVDKQVEALNALSGDPVTIDKLHHGFDQSTSFLIAWSTYLYAIKRYRPDYAPLIRGDDTQVGSMAMDILHHRPSPWTEHVSYPDDMPIAWVNDWIHAWRGYPHAEHFVPYHQRPMIYERLSAYHREKHGSMSADDPRILDHISHMHMIMHRDISGRIIDDAANLILSHFDHGPGRDYPDYMCRAISDYVRLVHMHRSYHPQGPDDHGRIEDMALAISNRTATMSVRLRLSDDMLARVIARRGSTSVHRVFDPFHQDLGLHALTSYITSRYHGLNRRDSFSHAFISEASVRESIQHSLMPCSCRAIAILMLGDESMMLDGARILQAMDNSSTS